MKTLLFIVALFVSAITIFAFAKPEPSKKAAVQYMWFDFTGTSTSQYADLNKYSQDPNHSNPCDGAGLRCEIYAPVIATGPNAGKPDLSNVIDETLRP